MNTRRVYFLMLGITGFFGALILITAFLGSNLLKKEADKLHSLKVKSRVIEEQQVVLTRAKKDIEKYSELEKVSKTLVPQDKDQAATVRQIVKIASDSGVSISSISFPSSTLGQSTPKTETNSTAEPAPVAKTTPLTQVKPAEGLPGLYAMEISVTQDKNKPISYAKFIDFLSRLEQNRRTAQVTSIAVEPSAAGADQLSFSLTVNVYIKP